MELILITLVITAPLPALGTAVFLWGRRYSTPDRMRYRILQAALLAVGAATVVYVALLPRADAADRPRAVRVLLDLALLGVAFAYLAKELRRARDRLKS